MIILIRRASYQHAPGNSRTEPAREGNITPPTIDAQDLPPSRTRFVRPSATGFHNSGDESALERPSNGVRLVVAQAPGRRGDTPPRTRSRKHPVTVDADAIRHVEDVSTGRAYRARTNEVEAVSRESDGQGSESGSIHADRKEASVGLPPSLKVDRWDPAVSNVLPCCVCVCSSGADLRQALLVRRDAYKWGIIARQTPCTRQ